MYAKTLNVVLIAIIIILLSIKSKKVVETQPSGTITKQEVKAIANDLNVKEKDIKAVVQFDTETKASVKAKVDTIIIYKDRWTDIQITPDSTDSVKIDYSIQDSLSVVTFQKRKWFLAPYHTYIDVNHSNPNVQTNSIRSYQIPIKQKKWAIGVGVQYGWNGKQWQPTIGISLQRTLIRF